MVKQGLYILILFILVLRNTDGNNPRHASYGIQPEDHIERNFSCTPGEACIIELDKTEAGECFQILVSNGLSSAIINPYDEGELCVFEIPQLFSNQVGSIRWKAVNFNANGIIIIEPVDKIFKIEAYLGPPSLVAGEESHADLSGIAFDNWGNLTKDSTALTLNEMRSNRVDSVSQNTEMGLGIFNISPGTKSGKSILHVQSQDKTTKEFELVIHPSVPLSLDIRAERVHNFADGHQTLTLSTNQLKDSFGNIISDGSLVEFKISDSNNNILTAQASTTDGVARATVIHPDETCTWTISGGIPGMIWSSPIELKFENAFRDFPVSFDSENKIVKIGPVISFMGQLAPNGTEVRVELNQNNSTAEVIQVQLIHGVASIDLNSTFGGSGKYDVTVKLSNLTKTLKSLSL